MAWPVFRKQTEGPEVAWEPVLQEERLGSQRRDGTVGNMDGSRGDV